MNSSLWMGLCSTVAVFILVNFHNNVCVCVCEMLFFVALFCNVWVYVCVWALSAFVADKHFISLSTQIRTLLLTRIWTFVFAESITTSDYIPYGIANIFYSLFPIARWVLIRIKFSRGKIYEVNWKISVEKNYNQNFIHFNLMLCVLAHSTPKSRFDLLRYSSNCHRIYLAINRLEISSNQILP